MPLSVLQQKISIVNIMLVFKSQKNKLSQTVARLSQKLDGVGPVDNRPSTD